MTGTRLDMGEAPTAAGAPPLTRRRVDQPMDTTPQQLREGAAALRGIDRTGVPTDVRDLARAAAAYARLVARHLSSEETDAGATEDLLQLGETVLQHAALTARAGEGRPQIQMVAAASRWLVFAAQYPLANFPHGPDTVATAVHETIIKARAAASAPDRTVGIL